MEIISDSLRKTKKIGEILAKEVLEIKTEKALFFGLEGDLGSGKTSFVQGFAKGLGIRGTIPSPTFVIMRKYGIKLNKAGFNSLYHIDCYRIEKPEEILELGFKKILESQNIIVIEWANRIKSLLPKNSVIVKFDFIDNKTRKIII